MLRGADKIFQAERNFRDIFLIVRCQHPSTIDFERPENKKKFANRIRTKSINSTWKINLIFYEADFDVLVTSGRFAARAVLPSSLLEEKHPSLSHPGIK